MRVHVLDPSAYTPPYDHALCHALGEAGIEVDLFTSRFSYGQVAEPDSYCSPRVLLPTLSLAGQARRRRSRTGLAAKLASMCPDMLRYRRAPKDAQVAHFQWLTVQPIDRLALAK